MNFCQLTNTMTIQMKGAIKLLMKILSLIINIWQRVIAWYTMKTSTESDVNNFNDDEYFNVLPTNYRKDNSNYKDQMILKTIPEHNKAVTYFTSRSGSSKRCCVQLDMTKIELAPSIWIKTEVNKNLKIVKDETCIGLYCKANIMSYNCEVTVPHILNLFDADTQLKSYALNPCVYVNVEVNHEKLKCINKTYVSTYDCKISTKENRTFQDYSISTKITELIRAPVMHSGRQKMDIVACIITLSYDKEMLWSGSIVESAGISYIVTIINEDKRRNIITMLAVAMAIHDFDITIV